MIDKKTLKAGVLAGKPVPTVPARLTVSPEEPISKVVPDCGSSLSTNKVAILYYR